MTKIQIRDYIDSDWDRCREVHDLARPIELQGSCDPRAFVPLADDAEDLAEFQGAKKYVASVPPIPSIEEKIEEKVIGFVGVDGSDVGWLYVDPSSVRQGVGRALLRYAMTQIITNAPTLLPNAPGISVYVLEGNTPALKLYRSEAFETVDKFQSKNNGYRCTVLKLRYST